MKKVSEDQFIPIPTEEKAQWDKLVNEGKKLVTARDKQIWKLILLTGKIETVYGESRIKRFADEIGLDKRTIYTYRWLARSGVDEEFINKWSSLLSYTMIREILRHTGRVAAPSTQFFLDYAASKKITVQAMRSFMLDSVTPDNIREQAAKDIQLALRDKQDHEGFSDYIRFELEKIAEEKPELQNLLLKTSLVGVEDLVELKVAAGIATDEEETLERKAAYQAQKFKRYFRSISENKGELKQHLAYAHQNSGELRLFIAKLWEVLDEILKTEEVQQEFDADVVEITQAKGNRK